MTFLSRVVDYIRANYDPYGMEFHYGQRDPLEFEDWVEECIKAINDDLDAPYDDDSDEYDVSDVGDMILNVLIGEHDGIRDNDGDLLFVVVEE